MEVVVAVVPDHQAGDEADEPRGEPVQADHLVTQWDVLH